MQYDLSPRTMLALKDTFATTQEEIRIVEGIKNE
jgi:hypothetical protein